MPIKRVLLVGKHSLFRQILALVLKWNTDLKETIEAGSLTEARRVLGNPHRKPHLAIVDLDMANGDGFDLINELRTSAPDVPTLAVTLRADAERRDRALQAGAQDVLTMSASPKEIVDVAKQLVGE
jgi:DNA-binding NarL/FixJ family response regulator